MVPAQRVTFLRVVLTSESPKVMGLMDIHDPNALQHYAGYTFLVCTTVTISSKYVCQLSAMIVKNGVFLRGLYIPPFLF